MTDVPSPAPAASGPIMTTVVAAAFIERGARDVQTALGGLCLYAKMPNALEWSATRDGAIECLTTARTFLDVAISALQEDQ